MDGWLDFKSNNIRLTSNRIRLASNNFVTHHSGLYVLSSSNLKKRVILDREFSALLAVISWALCQKLCSRYAHWSISGHWVKSYAHVMLTGQSPGIESKVMLTLCSLVNLRALCQKLCSRYAHWSISGHYVKSYAHIMLIGQSPGIPGIIIEGKWAVLP